MISLFQYFYYFMSIGNSEWSYSTFMWNQLFKNIKETKTVYTKVTDRTATTKKVELELVNDAEVSIKEIVVVEAETAGESPGGNT